MPNSRLPQVWKNKMFLCHFLFFSFLYYFFFFFPITANPITCPRQFFFFKENKSFETEVTLVVISEEVHLSLCYQLSMAARASDFSFR